MENEIKYKGLWKPQYMAEFLFNRKGMSIQDVELHLKSWAMDIIEVNKIIKPKYISSDGLKVVAFLKANGFMNSTLIGSLGKGNHSDHDIDILIFDRSKAAYGKRLHGQVKEGKRKLIELLKPERWEETDWEGIYLWGTKFGDVDCFFTTKGFTY